MRKDDDKFNQKKIVSSLAIASVLAVAAFSFTILIKSKLQDASQPIGKREVLIEQIKKAEKQEKELKNQIDDLRKQLSKLEKEASLSDIEVAKLNKKLEKLRFAVGLAEAVGPGIEITIKDAESPVQIKEPESYLVHDYDLRIILNALFSSGAEAVSINGERISFITSIRCVGPTVLINAKRISSPFTVLAIGDPDRLKKGLVDNKESNDLINKVFPVYGIGFQLQKKQRVQIPPFRRGIGLNYAQVIEN